MKKQTLNRIKVLLVISAFIWGLGVCSLFGQTSLPTNPQFHALQTELAGYIEEFAHSLKMPRSRLQWSVLVLPRLGLRGPAIVAHWVIPPSPPEFEPIWLAIFTFRGGMMLQIDSTFRRIIAAHEIGHLTSACQSFWIPTGSPRDIAVRLKTLEESCADIISAQLVSPRATLEVLEWLLGVYPESEILPTRVETMRKLIEEEGGGE